MSLKLTLLFVAGLAWGQEMAKPGINGETTSVPKPEPPPTVDLQKKLAETQANLEAATKLLKEYYGKYRACDEEFTQFKVLGPPKPAQR